jgi:hypothetical protein
VVTVQPSSTVVDEGALVVGAVVGVRVGGFVLVREGLRAADGDRGFAGAVEVAAGDDGVGGTGVGVSSAESRNCSTETRAPSSAVAVRSTGSIATEASATLVSVAAHQPSTGNQLRRDRTWPCSHLPLWLCPWR